MENQEQNNQVVPISEEKPVVVPKEDVVPAVSEEEQLKTVEEQKENVTPVIEPPVAAATSESVVPVDNTVVQKPPVEESNVVNTQQQNVVPEKEEVSSESDNKGPSFFAKFMTVILFVFFFAFVYFLPEVTDYINLQKSLRNQKEITTGRLVCKNTKTTDTLDIGIEATFDFTDLKLDRLTHITTSTGDKIEDKEELDKLREDCSVLKNEVSEYDGISVICSLNSGVSVVKQILNYEMIKTEEIKSSYAEAGGIYVDFKYQDDIKNVESKMTASGYTCERMNY